jgi:hypothetical protein
VSTTTASSHASLIASDRVEGTAVYNREGEKLGSIENFMVDKLTGKVEYANLSFGGLFGMGASIHPLPWGVLDYVPEQNGYVVDLDKAKLEKAPKYERGAEPAFDRDYNRNVNDYYGLPLI